MCPISAAKINAVPDSLDKLMSMPPTVKSCWTTCRRSGQGFGSWKRHRHQHQLNRLVTSGTGWTVAVAVAAVAAVAAVVLVVILVMVVIAVMMV